MKKIIKSLIPPIFLIFLSKLRNRKYGWKGSYASWNEAQLLATGYEQELILNKVKDSALKVKSGEAVYERDSVLFDEVEYSWPILSGLLLAAIETRTINVLDFGGSLGSSYYQNKKFLDMLEKVSWSVIEQPQFVREGKKHFEDERLKFYIDIDSYLSEQKPEVLLLSSVIQYIEKPYELLEKLIKMNFKYILIDKTPFSLTDEQQIKLQTVHPSIYRASYPCWFFSETDFNKFFTKNGFCLLESFDSPDISSEGVFKGMLYIND